MELYNIINDDIFISLVVYSFIYIILCHINYTRSHDHKTNTTDYNTKYNTDYNTEYNTDYINSLLNKQMIINSNERIQIYEQPPEFIKLQELLLDFTRNHTWDNVISIGDIYKNGAYPRFKHNKNMALECYKVAAMSPNSEVAGIAQVKYIETASVNTDDYLDNKGEEIPQMFGIEICELAKEIIKNTPYNSFNKPKSQNTIFEPIYHDIMTNATPFAFFVDTIEERPTAHHTYRNDLQNVHDSSVTGIIKKNINEIKKSSQTTKNNTTSAVVTAIAGSEQIPETVKANAIMVITDLNEKDIHGTYNITEKDALSMVWNKINNEKEDTKKKNMIDILARQLDSGVENGHIVCSSGKIARIISTFDGVDESIEPSRPIWAIREEIGSLAGKIMNGNYNNPKIEFINKATDVYIHQLHLEPNVINPIITEYSEHL